MSYGLSVICYRLSVIGYASASLCLATKALRHEGFYFRLWVMSYGLSVIGYRLWGMSYELSVICFPLCVSKFVFSHEGAKAQRFLFSVIRYGLSVMSYRL